MKLRILFSILCLFFIATAVGAQSSGPGDPPVEEQNETMLDTLKRMQIKREENEHKKILEKGEQLKLDAEMLAKEAAPWRVFLEGARRNCARSIKPPARFARNSEARATIRRSILCRPVLATHLNS